MAAYLSAGTEPDTLAVIDQLAEEGVEILLPASRGGAWSEPAWAVYGGRDALRAGPRGILEPIGRPLPASAAGRAQVVLCPGLAGTRRGERLGRGGGWYDRVLPLTTGHRILLLNDEELLDTVPTTELDQRVDVIVTPSRRLEVVSEPGTRPRRPAPRP